MTSPLRSIPSPQHSSPNPDPLALQVVLSAASPDPHVFVLPDSAEGRSRGALTYTSSHAMVKRDVAPRMVPIHLARADGTFEPKPDRHVFTADVERARRALAPGEPAPQPLPEWALQSFSTGPGVPGTEVWAPEIWPVTDELGRGFFLLLCTMRRKDGHLVIAAFTATDLMGEWTGVEGSRPGLLLEDLSIGLIDATYFRHPPTGRQYLVWKEDGNDKGRLCRLLMQEVVVSARRIDFLRQPVVAAVNDPTTWHGDVLEGPAFFYDAATQRTWVIVSGNNCYGPNYAMGALEVSFHADGSLGFDLLPDPILDNMHPLLLAAGEVGAGHCSVHATEAGHRAAFHTWKRDAPKGVELDDRQARAAPLSLVEGVPSVGGHPPTARNRAHVAAREGRQYAKAW